MAAGRGAPSGDGADAARRARHDATAGEAAVARLRAERADQLAQDSALRHAEGAEEVGASAARGALRYVRTLASVAGGLGRRLLRHLLCKKSATGVPSDAVIRAGGHVRPFHRVSVAVIMDAVSGFSSVSRPRNLGVFPSSPGCTPILGVFWLIGQPKRDGSIIVRSYKASQSPVYPIRDAILAVNHASCPSLSSPGSPPVG